MNKKHKKHTLPAFDPNLVRFDLRTMKTVFNAPIADFAKLSRAQITETKHGQLVYIDNHASILAVAHLDSQVGLDHFYPVKIDGEDGVLSSRVDDRVGAYVILHVLKTMGVKCDILLTEGEETGRSTAQFFSPPKGKKYHWMVSFDRHGEDAVCYTYEIPELRNMLTKSGFTVGVGSISDICYLTFLGCRGFNVGVGYKDEHSAWGFVDLNILRRQVARFLTFYTAYKDAPLPFAARPYSAPTPASYYAWPQSNAWRYDYGDNYDDNWRSPTRVSAATRQGHLSLPPHPCIICDNMTARIAPNGQRVCLLCQQSASHCVVCEKFFASTSPNADGICPDCQKISEAYPPVATLSLWSCSMCRTPLTIAEFSAGFCSECQLPLDSYYQHGGISSSTGESEEE